MWIKLILALLQIVAAVLKSRSDEEQQQIGEDRSVQKALAEILNRSKLARQISDDSRTWTADDIDDRLHKYYREGIDPDSSE